MKAGSFWSVNSAAICVLIFASLLQVECQQQNRTRKVSNVCLKDSDCPDNAFCKITDGNGYCNCKNEYLISIHNTTHTECVKEAKDLGDICKVDLQCQSRLSLHSICKDGTCQCKEGAHFDDGRCYETAIIGQRCRVTQNCYLGPDQSRSNQAYCVKGICVCNLLHNPRDQGTRCLKDASLGDQCEDNEHCTVENTKCESVCRCLEGYIMHEDEQRCLKVALALGDSCEVEAQCTAKINGTTCMEQKCACNWGFHMFKGVCWQSRFSGQKCTDNQECIVTDTNEPGECKNGLCTCIGCKASGAASVLDRKSLYTFTILSAIILLSSVLIS